MQEMVDPYIRTMFGQYAIQVPFNCIVQPSQSEDVVIAVVLVRGNNVARNFSFGSDKTHQLIMGDAVIRPRLVVESDHLIGMGISGIARDGFADVDSWIHKGNILLNNDSGISLGKSR